MTTTPASKSEGGATQQTPAAKESAAAVRYVYEYEHPEFAVASIHIEHDAAGSGLIRFARRTDTEPIVEPLELAPAALSRINGYWTALNFLDSKATYQTEKQFPNLGTTRLRMTEGQRERTAEFNYSGDRNAFLLADEYRRAAEQAMLVFEIKVARESQTLDTPKLLSRLDALISRKAVSDAQQLVPLLRDMSTDESLPLIARNQATRTLKKITEGK